jgi:hypothetical protein
MSARNLAARRRKPLEDGEHDLGTSLAVNLSMASNETQQPQEV